MPSSTRARGALHIQEGPVPRVGFETPLPPKVVFEDDRKIWKMAKNGGFTLNISVRRDIEEALRNRRCGIWLELKPEQYEKLRRLS